MTKILNCRTKWQEVEEIVNKPIIIYAAEYNGETQSWDLAYEFVKTFAKQQTRD